MLNKIIITVGFLYLAACGSVNSASEDSNKPTIDSSNDGIVSFGTRSANSNTTVIPFTDAYSKSEYSKYVSGLPSDAADPRIIKENGTYYLVYTSSNAPNIPMYESKDLRNWSFSNSSIVKAVAGLAGGFTIDTFTYCNVWGPKIIKDDTKNQFILLITAVRIPSSEKCPTTDPWKNMGVYVLTSPKVNGPFQNIKPMGVECKDTSVAKTDPNARCISSNSCARGDKIIRLDPNITSTVINGMATHILTFSSYDNSQFENEHISYAVLDNKDLTKISCTPNNGRRAYSSNSAINKNLLVDSCNRSPNSELCKLKLSFNGIGTSVDSHTADQTSQFHVAEGTTIFFRNNRYYLISAISSWDSPLYQTFSATSNSLIGLFEGSVNASTSYGMFTLPQYVDLPGAPMGNYAVGHGEPVQGPDGSWYYLQQTLNASKCSLPKLDPAKDCSRPVMLTKINFDSAERIKPVYPMRFEIVRQAVYDCMGLQEPEANDYYQVILNGGNSELERASFSYESLMGICQNHLQNYAEERQHTIERSYLKAYGRMPNSEELTGWLNGVVLNFKKIMEIHQRYDNSLTISSLYYELHGQIIGPSNLSKYSKLYNQNTFMKYNELRALMLNDIAADFVERKEIINRSYQAVFNRYPAQNELDYWISTTLYSYSALVEKHKNYRP